MSATALQGSGNSEEYHQDARLFVNGQQEETGRLQSTVGSVTASFLNDFYEFYFISLQ